MDGESVDAADAQEHRKLEGLALEYTQLLRSQLARQRDVYEQRLAARAGGVVDAAAEARVADLRAEVRALERRAARDRKRLEATESDLVFLEEVSGALASDADAREADARNAEAELVKAKSDADRLARALEAKLDVAMSVFRVPCDLPRDGLWRASVVTPSRRLLIETTSAQAAARGRRRRRAAASTCRQVHQVRRDGQAVPDDGRGPGLRG